MVAVPPRRFKSTTRKRKKKKKEQDHHIAFVPFVADERMFRRTPKAGGTLRCVGVFQPDLGCPFPEMTPGPGMNPGKKIIRCKEDMIYSSACKNGLGISSLPSAGEINTIKVPRATIRPIERVFVLPSSSVESQLVHQRMEGISFKQEPTTHGFLDFIEDQVHQLIIALEDTSDWGYS